MTNSSYFIHCQLYSSVRIRLNSNVTGIYSVTSQTKRGAMRRNVIFNFKITTPHWSGNSTGDSSSYQMSCHGEQMFCFFKTCASSLESQSAPNRFVTPVTACRLPHTVPFHCRGVSKFKGTDGFYFLSHLQPLRSTLSMSVQCTACIARLVSKDTAYTSVH